MDEGIQKELSVIKNWEYKTLQMDFSSMFDEHNHPSDLDMIFIGKDERGREVLIIGEMKQANYGTLKDGQRHLLEHIANNYKHPCIVLYITHQESIQKGDRKVDVSRCKVEEYYYSPLKTWAYPYYHTTVMDVIDKYRR